MAKQVIFVHDKDYMQKYYSSLDDAFILKAQDFMFKNYFDENEMTKTAPTELMTRQEAINKCHGIANADALIQMLEALGLLKLKPPGQVKNIISDRSQMEKYGAIVIEEWPEGLVVWVGGRIVYESWKNDTSKT